MWRGVFMWDMRYAWNLAPKKYTSWQLTPVDPFPNPVLVGCSLAVDKNWFYSIGRTTPHFTLFIIRITHTAIHKQNQQNGLN